MKEMRRQGDKETRSSGQNLIPLFNPHDETFGVDRHMS